MLDLNNKNNSGKLAPSELDNVEREVAATDAEPQADLNASIEYRTHLAQVLVRRALTAAS